MTSPLYVVFTMDCERIATLVPEDGPESWALSERAITGFCETLLADGITPTLFLMPEAAQRHRRLLRDLAAEGVDLGMHMHSQYFGKHQYTRYVGEYAAETQAKVLQEGLPMIADTLGDRPTSFRPGNFSASDATFGVLAELGFSQGSVSCPGRDIPRFHALWRGACQDAHWAHPTERLSPGLSGFLEVPLTTSPRRVTPEGWVPELRIESGSYETHHLPIVEESLERMEAERTPFRVLCFFTHNYFDYADEQCPQSVTLKMVVRQLQTLRNIDSVCPVNLASLRTLYVELEES